jgi:hypothetical protein
VIAVFIVAMAVLNVPLFNNKTGVVKANDLSVFLHLKCSAIP